jgi:hypothetical protein
MLAFFFLLERMKERREVACMYTYLSSFWGGFSVEYGRFIGVFFLSLFWSGPILGEERKVM